MVPKLKWKIRVVLSRVVALVGAVGLIYMWWNSYVCEDDLNKNLDPGGSLANESRNTSANVRASTHPRVLCWILTGPSNHMTRAIHVKRTWGSRCDVLLFMSSVADHELGSIALPNVTEGHNKLWPKTKAAFQYVWKHYRNEVDWFYKADDDTYVIMEHLHDFLKDYDTEKPYFFGCTTRYKNIKEDVNLGGPGYVLSREALRLFVEKAVLDEKNCGHGYKGDEDTLLSICLANVGVYPTNTRDRNGRLRFVHTRPHDILKRYAEKGGPVFERNQLGMFGISDSAISFHYIEPKYMYVYELMIYHLQLHRRTSNPTVQHKT